REHGAATVERLRAGGHPGGAVVVFQQQVAGGRRAGRTQAGRDLEIGAVNAAAGGDRRGGAVKHLDGVVAAIPVAVATALRGDGIGQRRGGVVVHVHRQGDRRIARARGQHVLAGTAHGGQCALPPRAADGGGGQARRQRLHHRHSALG